MEMSRRTDDHGTDQSMGSFYLDHPHTCKDQRALPREDTLNVNAGNKGHVYSSYPDATQLTGLLIQETDEKVFTACSYPYLLPRRPFVDDAPTGYV